MKVCSHLLIDQRLFQAMSFEHRPYADAIEIKLAAGQIGAPATTHSSIGTRHYAGKVRPEEGVCGFVPPFPRGRLTKLLKGCQCGAGLSSCRICRRTNHCPIFLRSRNQPCSRLKPDGGDA